jgi:hypothetical protein
MHHLLCGATVVNIIGIKELPPYTLGFLSEEIQYFSCPFKISEIGIGLQHQGLVIDKGPIIYIAVSLKTHHQACARVLMDLQPLVHLIYICLFKASLAFI